MRAPLLIALLLQPALAQAPKVAVGGSEVGLAVNLDPRSRLANQLTGREKQYQQTLERLEGQFRWQIERIADRRKVLQSEENELLEARNRAGREWTRERRELATRVVEGARQLDFLLRSLEEAYDAHLRALLDAAAAARELKLDLDRHPDWPEDVLSRVIRADIKKLLQTVVAARARRTETGTSRGSADTRYRDDLKALQEARRARSDERPPEAQLDATARALLELKDEAARLEHRLKERRVGLGRKRVELLDLDLEQQGDRIEVLAFKQTIWNARLEEVAAREQGGVLAVRRGILDPEVFRVTLKHSTQLVAHPVKTADAVRKRVFAWRVDAVGPWLMLFLLTVLSFVAVRWTRPKIKAIETENHVEAAVKRVGMATLWTVPCVLIFTSVALLELLPEVLDRFVWVAAFTPMLVVSARVTANVILENSNGNANTATQLYFRGLLWLAVATGASVQLVHACLPVFAFPEETNTLANASFALVMLVAWLGLLTRKSALLHFLGADGDPEEIGAIRNGIRRLYRFLAIGPVVIFLLYAVGYVNLARLLIRGGTITLAVVLLAPWAYARMTGGVQAFVGYPEGGGLLRLSASGAKALYRGVFPIILFVVATISIGFIAAGWGYGGLLGNVADTVTYPLLKVGGSSISVSSFLLLGITISLSIALTRWLVGVLNDHVYGVYGLDRGMRATVDTLFRYFMFIVGTIVALDVVGVGVGVLTVFAGVIGIGVGFGSQKIAANFISGIILLVTRPVRVDDWLRVEGVEGRVVRISSMFTTLRTPLNVAIIIPNSDLLSSSITNLTVDDPRLKVCVRIGVKLESDVEAVRALLAQAASEHPRCKDLGDPEVLFQGPEESALIFVIRPLLDGGHGLAGVESEIRRRANELLGEAGVELPIPRVQTDLLAKAQARGWHVEPPTA